MAEDNASNLQTIATKLKVTTKTPEKSSEAALSDLTLDGITITGFDSEKIAYTIELAAKTTEIPTVVAIATDSKATVNITQATELPGVTTVVVTAEDGTTKIYTINFTLAPQEEPTIVKINDLTALVKVGEAYTLPKTVIALMSDDTTRELPVTWKPSTADTDEEGEYSFIGTVENYDTKVTLILQVIAEEIATYTVEVIANPPAGGTVTGGGEYPAGTSVTVSATTNKGYTFINWTEKEAPISTEAVYAFSMRAEAVCLTANFRETLNLVTNITVTGAEGATTVEKDKTLQMSVAIEPAEATDKSVTWSVENGTGSATIDTTGLLTGTAKGTVTVKATANDISGVVGMLEVTVVEPVGAAWTVGTATTMARLGAGAGKTAGTDFDSIYPWSEMKLCNVADDGTINAYIDDAGFKRDGTKGQVMVQIPKFYYKHTYKEGGHEFWVADAPIEGFELHPCFIRAGVEKDYVLMGAYKAGEINDGGTIKLTSISDTLPAVSRTRATFRAQAQNRGESWNIVDALARNAVALLYLVEYADTNCQTAIGRGIVDLRYYDADTITEATTGNTIIVSSTTGSYFKVGQIIDVGTSRGARNICRDRKITEIMTDAEAGKTTITVDGASFTTAVDNIIYHVGQKTGGCDSLNGASGIALLGTDGETGVNGRVSVSYRGLEDLWGNVWEFIDGINIKNRDALDAPEQQPYIADSNFVDNTFTGDYQASGVILPSGNGYVKDFACSEAADWLLMPGGDTKAEADVAVGGNYDTYIPDYYYQDWPRNDYADKVALVGGRWNAGDTAGLFLWLVDSTA